MSIGDGTYQYIDALKMKARLFEKNWLKLLEINDAESC